MKNCNLSFLSLRLVSNVHCAGHSDRNEQIFEIFEMSNNFNFATMDKSVICNVNSLFLNVQSIHLGSVSQTSLNRLTDMPILGSSSSAANKDMMSEIWTNWDTIICLSRKHCGKRINCSLRGISPFPAMFSVVDVLK